MTLSDVIRILRSEGHPATVGRINYAVLSGRLDDVELDGAGNRNFSGSHLEKLRQYLKSQPRRGRKPPATRKGEEVAI